LLKSVGQLVSIAVWFYWSFWVLYSPSHRGGLRSGRGRGRGRGGWSRGLGGGGGRGLGGGGRGRGRGSGSGRGRGQGRKKPVEKSSAELDKELENYHAEAMQT